MSFQQAQTLLNKYGEDLDGIFAMTSVATPNSADAVQQAGLCEDVAVVGLATPNGMKPYVNDGCVRDVILWNPVDLGYAAVYVMRAVVDGEFSPGDASVSAGRLGDLVVVNGSEVLAWPALRLHGGQHQRLRLLGVTPIPQPLQPEIGRGDPLTRRLR